MRDQNKMEDKNLKIDTIQIKVKRYINKNESVMSKILYIISSGWFLFESIILGLAAVYSYLLNIGAWIYLLIAGGLIIFIPIMHYFKINKKLNPSDIKSFEMLSSIIFFIASLIINYIPEFPSEFGTINSVFPGKYVVGIFTILFFIMMSVIFILKPGIRVKENFSFESIKSKLEKIILDNQVNIESNENKFKEGLISMEMSQNYEKSVEILKIYTDNLENYEKLFFCKEQLLFMENDPKFLQKMVEIEHKKKTPNKPRSKK